MTVKEGITRCCTPKNGEDWSCTMQVPRKPLKKSVWWDFPAIKSSPLGTILKIMKKNLYIFVVAIIALFGAVSNIQAQETITISEEERALALSTFTNGNCFVTPEADDGTLQIALHGYWYAVVSGNYTINNYSNNDGVGDTGTKNTAGFDAGLGYLMNKKGWSFAPQIEVKAGVNSKQHVENRELKSSFHASATALVGLSHGVVRPALGLVYSYENMVSENINGTPWRGHVHEFDVAARLTMKIGSYKQSKTAKVGNKKIPVRALKEINGFIQASYGLADIGKYWDDADALKKGFEPELKNKRLKLEAGITICLW
jgi:hypothetical protein